MNHRRLYGLALLFNAVTNSANAQITFYPGDTALRYGYIKERNVFQKPVWMDPNGVITHTAILNLITKVDTIQHTVTCLQIRNDGTRDSNVSSYPAPEPIYLSAKDRQFVESHDYRKKDVMPFQLSRMVLASWKALPGLLFTLAYCTLPIANWYYSDSLGKGGKVTYDGKETVAPGYFKR